MSTIAKKDIEEEMDKTNKNPSKLPDEKLKYPESEDGCDVCSKACHQYLSDNLFFDF